MRRRDFLISATSALVLPRFPAAATTGFKLVAEHVSAKLVPEYDFQTDMLGFNGSMPGPVIRGIAGAPLRVSVTNHLDEGTAVHWHGIRLANKMDGVPMLTQNIIGPNETFTYDFTPPDAGTFWYHSHYNSQEQVARGLAGPLIIHETTPIDVDHDISVLLSDWLMTQDGQLSEEFSTMHSVAHAGYMGNYARAFFSQDTVRQGDRIRLRLINAATNRIFPLNLRGAKGKIVALDGMPLETPRDIQEILIAPAQRMDLILDVQETLTLDLQTHQGAFSLGTLALDGKNTKRTPQDILALPAKELPHFGEIERDLTLSIMGGAMGGRHNGNNIWALDDVSDLQPTPWKRFNRGEVVKITLKNDTAFPHAMHLHGHHFYELDTEGKLGDFRDTTLVDADSSRDILCRFDNPGKWLFHCHMLSHALGGMRTWVQVA
jgi:FtsP/CotA-like multicopper oxidase with cupredoxin domain